VSSECPNGGKQGIGKLGGIASHHKRNQGIADGPAEAKDGSNSDPAGRRREQHAAHLLDPGEAHGFRRQVECGIELRQAGLEDQGDGRENEQAQGQHRSQQRKSASGRNPFPQPRHQQEHRYKTIYHRGDAGHKVDESQNQAGEKTTTKHVQ